MRHIFYLKNNDSLNSISAVAVHGNSIAIGTSTGKIELYDRQSMKIRGFPFEAHEREVTGIWIWDDVAIVSSSHDQHINIKLIQTADREDKKIKIATDGYGLSLQSITVIDNKCKAGKLHCFIGTAEGHLIEFNQSPDKGRKNQYVVARLEKEGSVTQVIYQFGFLVWSTKKQILVMHYKRNERICKVDIPTQNANIPQQMYVSNKVMPRIQLVLNQSKVNSIEDV